MSLLCNGELTIMLMMIVVSINVERRYPLERSTVLCLASFAIGMSSKEEDKQARTVHEKRSWSKDDDHENQGEMHVKKRE